MEVIHPNKKADVAQISENDLSTKKNIAAAITKTKIHMYLYSENKNWFAPCSI